MHSCPHCNAPLAVPRPLSCPSCGAALGTVPPLPVAVPGLAWEGPGDAWRRLVDTTSAVLSRPSEFFRQMPPASPTPAVVYAAIVGGTAVLVSVLTEFGLQSALGIAFRQQPPAGLEALGNLFMGSSLLAMALIQVGVFLARLFVWSAIAHGLLMMVGSPRGTFEATLRVFCYAHATHLITILPFCGTLIALVYFLVVVVAGLAEVHGVSAGQAAFAVLAPLLVCCCCCFAGAATMVAPILAALSGAFGGGGAP